MKEKPHGTVAGVPFWFIPDQLCPNCGRRHDSAAAFDPAHRPQPGAGMFCGGRLKLLIFREDLRFRLATQAELEAIEKSPRERNLFAWHRWFTEVGKRAGQYR